MGDDTYKGESPGKKIARYRFWEKVARDVVGTDIFYDPMSRFVVLASREGGDIIVLKGVAVPPSCIVAVDRCGDAVRTCAAKHPDVDVRFGDIADVVDSLPKDRAMLGADVDVCFLDFCGYLTPQLIETCRRVCSALMVGSTIGIAFMRGRERAVSGCAPIPLNRLQRRYARSAFGLLDAEIDLVCGLSTDLRPAIAQARDAGDGDLAHARVLESILRFTCSGGKRPTLKGIINYHSRSTEGAGVPMCIAVFTNGYSGLTNSRQHKNFARTLNVGRQRQWIIRVSTTWREESIRKLVLSGHFDPNPGQVLNIPAGTIAAWKAHATRGTYEKGAA